MKIIILIMTWINRIIMTPFVIILLISIFDKEFFIYPMYIAFILGIYQLVSFLITLIIIKKLRYSKANLLFTYITIVILYFMIGHLSMDNYGKSDFRIVFQILLITVPILLSLFWTYILESIRQEL